MMKEKKYTQEDIYSVWSGVWSTDQKVSVRSLFSSRLFVEGYAVFKKYIPKSSGHILEVGTGSGRYGLAIARDNPTSTVVITDPLKESLSAVSHALSQIPLQNVTLKQEDALQFTFEDNTFDLVFADAVIQHIVDVDVAMKEMIRVLKPGGQLILSAVNTNNPPHRFYKWLVRLRGKEYSYGYEQTYTPTQIKELFEDHKLTNCTQDGFHLAYGIYRWGYRYPIFKWVARICNRVIKLLDWFTNRHISRKLGFIVFCVGEKNSRFY